MAETSSRSKYLGHWLKVVNHAMQVESNRILEPFGVTLSTWYILYQIDEAGRIAQKELQNRLEIESGSMAIIVDSLVRKGWLERTRDEKDRRANFLSLSAKGKQRWKKVPNFIETIREKMMKGVSKEEEALAVEVLKKCWSNLSSGEKEEEEQKV